MKLAWTTTELESNVRREVIIHQEDIASKTFDDKGLPTDIHLVEYERFSTLYVDMVRAGKMSDIFDVYYDKLKASGGGEIKSITSGFGTIKPKLYTGDQKDKKDTK